MWRLFSHSLFLISSYFDAFGASGRMNSPYFDALGRMNSPYFGPWEG